MNNILHNHAMSYALNGEHRSDPFAYRRALTHMRNGVGYRNRQPKAEVREFENEYGYPPVPGICYTHNSRA